MRLTTRRGIFRDDRRVPHQTGGQSGRRNALQERCREAPPRAFALETESEHYTLRPGFRREMSGGSLARGRLDPRENGSAGCNACPLEIYANHHQAPLLFWTVTPPQLDPLPAVHP